MKKEIWIVVANSSRAHFYKADNNQTLSLVSTLDHPESRLHAGDLVEDKPGRSFNSVGEGRHATEPGSDPKQVEANQFARQVVERLEKDQGSIGKLYLTANPAFLGQVRPLMTKPLQSLLAGEVTKDLTNLRPDQIRENLPYVL